jgi:hypothetical protein
MATRATTLSGRRHLLQKFLLSGLSAPQLGQNILCFPSRFFHLPGSLSHRERANCALPFLQAIDRFETNARALEVLRLRRKAQPEQHGAGHE